MTLESEPGEFSYPGHHPGSGRLRSCVYTWNRKRIKHAKFRSRIFRAERSNQ